jgi:hypothetical protein
MEQKNQSTPAIVCNILITLGSLSGHNGAAAVIVEFCPNYLQSCTST